MPQHPHNDRILKRLLPWLALIGFLGVALYALLPLDFWLPEYKSAHHTVTSGEALPDNIPPEDGDGGITLDNDQPPGAAQPEPPPGGTQPEPPPGGTKPGTAPSGEKPEPPSGGEEKIVESRGDFHKHYRIFRAVGNQWQHISKSDLNPVLITQLEPLQHKIEDEAISTVEILYSTYTKDGKTNPENSKIIAARLREGRYTYTYYARFEGKNIWYYDREGNAPEVAMDRIPLDSYDHISSPFDPARVHPITRIIRPHEGTDFKAAHGSPVRATGDGIVNYAGWRGGYGRVVIIDHENGYQTRYAHLSDIEVATGQEISRGQTVGRLGNSGMSTGSHLHYEVRINDIPYDPMTVQLPENKPLAENYKDAWRYRCEQYERELTEIATDITRNSHRK